MTKYRFNVRDFARAYEAYFGMKLREPRQVLGTPQDVQTPYRNGALVDPRQSQFEVSIILREPKNHHHDCYFCMVHMYGWNQRKKKD